MTRAEMRRANKKENKKKAVYTLTKEQLDELVRHRIENEVKQAKEEAVEEATNNVLALLLTLPLEVLMDHYWKKTYAKRIPEFTDHVIDYYNKWSNGELDMDKLKEDLWVYAGIRLEADKV